MAQDTQAEQEQSMEDILASIRKIISEDDEEAPAAAADDGVDDGDEDILELTDPLPDDEEAAAAADDEFDVMGAGPEDPDALVLVDDEPEPAAEPEPEPAPEPAPAAAASVPTPEPAGDGLMSPEAAALSAAAFASLGQGAVRSEMSVGDAKTLEGLVAELLRPMLKQWLDTHLPSMVETLVREEIQRVQSGGRRD